MLDSELDEVFAAFEAAALPTFRAAPLPEIAAGAGRLRRVRRWRLLVGLALVLALPAGAVAVAGRGDIRPVPHPTPTVTAPIPPTLPAVVPVPEQRHVPVPDSGLRLRELQFTHDAQHAWALFDSCLVTSSGRCRYALETTADAGLTWQRVAVPPLPGDAPVRLYTVSALIAAVHSVGHGFWVTVDGGLHYNAVAEDNPPGAALQGATWPYPGAPYTLLCSGPSTFEVAVDDAACMSNPQLWEIERGSNIPAPNLPGRLREIVTGADGRIWVLATGGNRTFAALSTTGRETWRTMTPVDAVGVLTVSPDGADAYLVAADPARLWLASGRDFVPLAGLPPGLSAPQVVALDDGVLAVRDVDDRAWFVGDGGYRPIDGGATGISRIDDGAMVLHRTDGSILVGTGTGVERTWVAYS